MSIEIDVFKLIDALGDRIQNNSPLDKNLKERIECATDIVYDESDPATCVYDTYHIPREEGKYPVMLYIHGGGFVAGDKKFRRGVSKWYAQTGLYVFNVNYGLCPAYMYPQPLVHIVKAFNRICEKAEELNLDLNKFIVAGDSAGAYYAAMLIAACNYKRVQKKLGVTPLSSVKAAIFNCGLYDIDSIMKCKMMFDLNARIFRRFTGSDDACFENYVHKKLCMPASYVNSAYPPCFIVYSKKDFFVGGQAESFIDKLAEKGVYFESYFSDVVFSNHCFPLNWKGKYAVTANSMTENFVKRFLEGKLPVQSKKVKKPKEVEDVDARQA